MKTLTTQVGAFTTTPAIADAVMEYWLTLVEDDRADVVEVPFVMPDGAAGRSWIGLSAATVIAVFEAPDASSDRLDHAAPLDDAAALGAVRARIAAAHAPAPVEAHVAQWPPAFWDDI